MIAPLFLAAAPEAAAPRAGPLLLEQEEARLGRMQAAARARSRAASLLAGMLCAEALDCAPTAIAIGRDHGGRPLARAPRPLHLSLSHGGGWVAAAASADHPVGIDIERAKPLPAWVLDHMMAPAERDWAGDDATRAMALWSLKEAWMKATGDGLRRDPRTAIFAIHETGVICGGAAAGWHAVLRRPAPDLALACCSPAPFTLRPSRLFGESTPW